MAFIDRLDNLADVINQSKFEMVDDIRVDVDADENGKDEYFNASLIKGVRIQDTATGGNYVSIEITMDTSCYWEKRSGSFVIQSELPKCRISIFGSRIDTYEFEQSLFKEKYFKDIELDIDTEDNRIIQILNTVHKDAVKILFNFCRKAFDIDIEF